MTDDVKHLSDLRTKVEAIANISAQYVAERLIHECGLIRQEAWADGRVEGLGEGLFIGLKQRRDEEHEMGRSAEAHKLLLQLLVLRGLVPTCEQRSTFLHCFDVVQLERWHARAVSVKSVDELLA